MHTLILKHLHLGGANLSYRKKFGLFFTVACVVTVLGGVKTANELAQVHHVLSGLGQRGDLCLARGKRDVLLLA